MQIKKLNITPITVHKQGKPIISKNTRYKNKYHAYIKEFGKSIVLLHVDMASKRCIFGGYISGNNIPSKIIIESDENSLHLGKSKSNFTIISFPKYAKWHVACCNQYARYDFYICMIRKW